MVILHRQKITSSVKAANDAGTPYKRWKKTILPWNTIGMKVLDIYMDLKLIQKIQPYLEMVMFLLNKYLGKVDVVLKLELVKSFTMLLLWEEQPWLPKNYTVMEAQAKIIKIHVSKL